MVARSEGVVERVYANSAHLNKNLAVSRHRNGQIDNAIFLVTAVCLVLNCMHCASLRLICFKIDGRTACRRATLLEFCFARFDDVHGERLTIEDDRSYCKHTMSAW